MWKLVAVGGPSEYMVRFKDEAGFTQEFKITAHSAADAMKAVVELTEARLELCAPPFVDMELFVKVKGAHR